jgi:hypothetical protein
MNIPGALVVAAGLIAGAVVVSGHGQAQSRTPEAAKAASAPPSVVGRYLLVATSGQDAWRIDTATGDVHYCVYKSNRVVCDK